MWRVTIACLMAPMAEANAALKSVRGVLTKSARVQDHQCSIPPWTSLPARERGSPPYSPPEDWEYDTKGGPVEGKINIHIVPHSHDDTGWLFSVDQYFQKEVWYILHSVVDALAEDENRRFVFVETAFFARWWEEQPKKRRELVTKLVSEGRLEFLNGGWCMHDEASPHYVEMVDQTTRGHQFLKNLFGEQGVPRGTWQIDPFGHSNTQAWLLSAEAGMESLFWGRTDFQDFTRRKAEKRLEWIWEGSASLGHTAQTFAGSLFGTGGGGYSTWVNFNSNGEQINDNPSRHDYNVDEWVDKVVKDAMEQSQGTATEHQMWAAGDDFNYQNAPFWYHNLDKLIHYVNQNGTVNAFYSTPTAYTDAKNRANVTWEVRRQDDVFPLGDDLHAYWTGYFTSRPALKRQVRANSNLLNAARQMEVFSGVTAAEVNTPTTRPSPRVGSSWTDSLEGTIGVATHHDGMSGSSTAAVTQDFESRMSESAIEVEEGVKKSLQRLMGSDQEMYHCNCHTAVNCLNISVCAYTTHSDAFSVVAWNPLAHSSRSFVRLPVIGTDWAVTGPTGKPVASQIVLLDDRTKSLPVMYINKAELSEEEVEQAQRALANDATHELVFSLDLPAVGYAVFSVEKSAAAESITSHFPHPHQPVVVSNGIYTLEFDADTNELAKISGNGVSTPLNLTWGWYQSSEGGCTDAPSLQCSAWRATKDCIGFGASDPSGDASCDASIETGQSGYCECEGGERREPTGCSDKHDAFTCAEVCARPSHGCASQKSGAYMFRPNSSNVLPPGSGQPTLTVVNGSIAVEVHQTYSPWVTHVIRLFHGEPFVELEYTVGPIPKQAPWLDITDDFGKEVIVRYDTSLASGKNFHTDSNAREMVKRVRNSRPESYPPLAVGEEVAGNYYPVNTMIALDDGDKEFAVLTDVTQGGSSLKSGSLELMVHRRVLKDDSRGLNQPLDETMCGCLPNTIILECHDDRFPYHREGTPYCYNVASRGGGCDSWCTLDPSKGDGCDGCCGPIESKVCEQSVTATTSTNDDSGLCTCDGLTVRGRHWLVLGSKDDVRAQRRALSERLNFQPTLAFGADLGPEGVRKQASFLATELPPNVKLQTLTSNYASMHGDRMLLRLAHLFAVGEHPTLSQPATVDLGSLFHADHAILEAEEVSLTGNQNREAMERRKYRWTTEGEPQAPAGAWVPSNGLTVTLRPMEVKTFLVRMSAASNVQAWV